MAAVAEQVRAASRRGVGRFLAAHEDCGSGFEIRRSSEDGRTRLEVVCGGCGARADYDSSQPGVVRVIDDQQLSETRRRRLDRAEVERWLPAPAALPWWVPNAYILLVIGAGLALIAFGVFGPSLSEDEPAVIGGGSSGSEAPQPEAPPPAAEPPAPAPAPGAAMPKPKLDRVNVLGRFSIGVPEGWSRGTGGGAIVLGRPGGDAEVRIFLEPGDDSTSELSREARKFLRQRHPGARVAAPDALRVGGDPAMRVVATYKGGEEHAIVLSEGGYSYLLLAEIDAGARPRDRAAALASARSFKSG